MPYTTRCPILSGEISSSHHNLGMLGIAPDDKKRMNAAHNITGTKYFKSIFIDTYTQKMQTTSVLVYGWRFFLSY